MTLRKKHMLAFIRVCILISGYIRAIRTYGGIQKSLIIITDYIVHAPWSILLYCCLYLIRPFILLPVGRLSLIAWVFWWRRPWLLIALGGEMVSACIAFANGRKLGHEALETPKETSFSKFSFLLLRHPLQAVIISRLTPLPDDVINYWRWILRISWPVYLRWTLLWNIPFSVLNVAMWVPINPQKLLTEWITTWVERSFLLPILAIYWVLLLLSWVIYRHLSNKENLT